MPRTLELLAPARTADIGIEAVRHGADAVYIGAERFGARAAAGNSVDDIARLVRFAHPFGAKVYVALNTLLSDHELDEARRLAEAVAEAGADALIVQDERLRQMGLPLPLHASTQMDNRTAEQVRRLCAEGYEQVVLARELSLDDIAHIHRQVPEARLEVFVHGALCVSLSGRCYVSEQLFGRSANRGECAQVCRMAFDLEDANGNKIVTQRHLLSLKDLCQLDALEQLAAAGATSFKIEGRLKGLSYVKNVTAAYSQALNQLVARHPDRYARASRGEVELHFRPDVQKSFNRGFTHYFLFGREADIFCPATPKSLGQPVGHLRRAERNCVVVDTTRHFANGDGLCCLTPQGTLLGFRVNRAEGARLYLHEQVVWPRGMEGAVVYRNFDKEFEDALARADSAERTLPLAVTLSRQGDLFTVEATDGTRRAAFTDTFAAETARTPQADNLRRQFARLGHTPFRLRDLTLIYKENLFIPSSLLTQWKNRLVELMLRS